MEYTDPLTLLLPTGLDARLELGRAHVETAYRDLLRFYGLLDRARRAIVGTFTDDEIGFLTDTTTSTAFPSLDNIRLFPFGVQDSLPDLAGSWEIDGAELMRKLQGLDVLQMCALVDALERCGNHVGNHDTKPTLEKWSDVLGEVTTK